MPNIAFLAFIFSGQRELKKVTFGQSLNHSGGGAGQILLLVCCGLIVLCYCFTMDFMLSSCLKDWTKHISPCEIIKLI